MDEQSLDRLRRELVGDEKLVPSDFWDRLRSAGPWAVYLVSCAYQETFLYISPSFKDVTSYEPARFQAESLPYPVITSKPARSLQTGGIYSLSRNPMYLGLLLLYAGLSLLIGNVWTMLLLPFLVLIVTRYVIKREERYLERAFGHAYQSYKEKVRRWL
ncbi:hypothetical protein GCM10027592_54200 [Spirosoma flavus]